ncbi:hypothetical protein HPB51_013548 [Rhipicephalus microplus]|uniref:Secreted protein n=1 Tax=Rhipicephalus microplus TaxID=6941 RepID=A0A9J6D9R2_RHIMP|nr:hypothetical protein HPB51_013548 [Rhipicephalus microplus]
MREAIDFLPLSAQHLFSFFFVFFFLNSSAKPGAKAGVENCSRRAKGSLRAATRSATSAATSAAVLIPGAASRRREKWWGFSPAEAPHPSVLRRKAAKGPTSIEGQSGDSRAAFECLGAAWGRAEGRGPRLDVRGSCRGFLCSGHPPRVAFAGRCTLFREVRTGGCHREAASG